MERVKPFVTLREPISEAYFPKMNSLVTSQAWPARAANTQLSDLNRELDQIKSDVTDLETWVTRFTTACSEGVAIAVAINSNPFSFTIDRISFRFFSVQPNGDKILLDDLNGIDLLGNMMESSMASVDRDYYGDIHNMGHTFISYAHDPEHRHLESFGVMGDSATAIRDPGNQSSVINLFRN